MIPQPPVTVGVDLLPQLTAGIELGILSLTLAGKIWDATPKELQAQSAGDWAKFIHNISAFILSLQEQINQLVIPPPHPLQVVSHAATTPL